MIDISKDHSRDLTTFTVNGEIIAHDMIQAIEEFYNSGPTRLALWNFLQAKGDSFSPADVDRIISVILKYASQRIGGKTVLVVSEDYAFGMSRLHATKAEIRDLKIDYHVTRSMDEAMEWLGFKK